MNPLIWLWLIQTLCNPATVRSKRGGGIDVGQHSKRARNRAHWHLVPESGGGKSDASSNGSSRREKPKLKLGIVLPRHFFQHRRYQAIISKSLDSLKNQELEKIRRHYTFEWQALTFRLDDYTDSINFEELKVAPPPSGM